MTGAPDVSVVMPAYNAASTVGAAAASVLWQSGVDLELIVVDDGSTDATADVVAALPGPLRLIRQDNQGVAVARNAGIAAARGRFVAFCDSDDLLFQTHLSALLATWQRSADGGVATADAYWLLPGGIEPTKTRMRAGFPEPARQRLAILGSNFVSIMALIPRELFDRVGRFDPSLRQGEDYEFWLRVIFAGYRVALQPRPLALYRWSTDGLSSRRESFYTAERQILQRVAEWPQLTGEEAELIRRRLASPMPRELLRSADDAIRGGEYRRAGALLQQAADLVPAEPLLARKSRLLGAAPFLVGPLLRRRLARAEAVLGTDERHAR